LLALESAAQTASHTSASPGKPFLKQPKLPGITGFAKQSIHELTEGPSLIVHHVPDMPG
jgi:hypothetical protein